MLDDKGFTPKKIAGLQFYFSADKIAGLADGDPVGAWLDLSGNGRDFTQATAAKKPTYKVGIQNSKPIVRTDGVDDNMETPAFQTFPSKRGSYFVVAKARSATLARHLLGIFFEAAGTLWQWQMKDTLTAFYDGSTTQTLESGLSSTFYLLEIIRTSNTTLEFYRNGSLKTTLTIADNQPTSQTLKMGSNVNAGDVETLDADYAALLGYDSALLATDRARVENFLMKQWGLLP